MARYQATIRRTVAGANPWYVIVEVVGAQDATSVTTGLANINAAFDSAKASIGGLPGVPSQFKVGTIVVDTVEAP